MVKKRLKHKLSNRQEQLFKNIRLHMKMIM